LLQFVFSTIYIMRFSDFTSRLVRSILNPTKETNDVREPLMTFWHDIVNQRLFCLIHITSFISMFDRSSDFDRDICNYDSLQRLIRVFQITISIMHITEKDVNRYWEKSLALIISVTISIRLILRKWQRKYG